MEDQNLQDLAALLDGKTLTDDQGNLQGDETTPSETSADSDEQTTEETTLQPEKAAEPVETATQAEDAEPQDELGVDESGKRYVPEKRFKDVYGKAKQLERELAEMRAKQAQSTETTQKRPSQKTDETVPADRTALLEVELLKSRLPQFDPESDQYDQELDNLGGEIYRANPGMSRLDAARRAIGYAKQLSQKVASAQTEARMVKAVQSDQGITSRGGNRGETAVDPNKMSPEQMEEWLKSNGAW